MTFVFIFITARLSQRPLKAVTENMACEKGTLWAGKLYHILVQNSHKNRNILDVYLAATYAVWVYYGMPHSCLWLGVEWWRLPTPSAGKYIYFFFVWPENLFINSRKFVCQGRQFWKCFSKMAKTGVWEYYSQNVFCELKSIIRQMDRPRMRIRRRPVLRLPRTRSKTTIIRCPSTYVMVKIKTIFPVRKRKQSYPLQFPPDYLFISLWLPKFGSWILYLFLQIFSNKFQSIALLS